MKKISELATKLLLEGEEAGVHDLYLLPCDSGVRLTFRRGEELREIRRYPQEVGERLILHFKFRGGMNVGETRRAQLGAMSFEADGKTRRLRLSSVGDFRNRESLVIRFLHVFGEDESRYFFPAQIETLQKNIEHCGLHLFCGPVGSGKTTLMYELSRSRGGARQMIAIEDPVEIEEESMLQLQVNGAIGQDYDELIKLCLRHRPDILIVGEIRDERTAAAVVRAALTGHTVFSTVHASSVGGIFRRLTDLGVRRVDLEECLSGVYYQRLLNDSENIPHVLLDIVTLRDNWRGHWNEHLLKLYEEGRIGYATLTKYLEGEGETEIVSE